MSSIAFYDENEKKRHHKHSKSENKHMYSKERKEMMTKQIANLHKTEEMESTSTQAYAAEVVEWQQKAKSHKSSSSLMQQNVHFQSVCLTDL